MDSGMVACVQSAKEGFGGLNISSDLRSQQFRRVEFSFIPHAPKELKTRSPGNVGHGRIKNERFNGSELLVEGRPRADVGDGIDEVAAVDRDTRDVDTVRRQQFVLGFEVQRRHSQFSASSRAFHNGSFNLKPSAEQTARALDFALLNSAAYVGAACDHATHGYSRDLDELKLVPPRMKCFDVSGLPVSEREVSSHAKPLCS